MVDIRGTLPKVSRPARYTGGEWNSIVKDWDSTELKVALAYPDLYEIGMSNLGLAIVYDLINALPYALAERVYAPWIDMEAELRQARIPLFSLESQRPLADFDIIGFSLGYELTYTNVLNMLDISGIPVYASERDGSHPLIIAGGSCCLNAEPVADFFDLFILGEGEEVVPELLESFRGWRLSGGGSKHELLTQLSRIGGVYVPGFYDVEYGDDGTISGISPTSTDIQPRIERRIVAQLPPPVTKPVVPFIATVHDRAAVEIQRGCTRGCRFCQAGIVYRPVRERGLGETLSTADELLKNCGYNELSLLSLSTSDYSEIEALVNSLLERYREDYLKISLPSLRIDSRSVSLMDSISTGKKTGLTFAPEAGTEGLRQKINKNLSEDELARTFEVALDRGWSSVKLYFMIGLPGETDDDIDGIVQLVNRGRPASKGAGSRGLHLRVSVSAFVPKAHTPFQWVPQQPQEVLSSKIETLRKGLKRSGVRLSWQEPRMSVLEGILARGDRRLSDVIYRAWQMGATFDAWSERFDYDKWTAALDECGLDPAFYTQRQRAPDEILPWSHIDVGVSQDFLRDEYRRSQKETATEDCRFGRCHACGLERWHTTCQAHYQSSSSSSP